MDIIDTIREFERGVSKQMTIFLEKKRRRIVECHAEEELIRMGLEEGLSGEELDDFVLSNFDQTVESMMGD